MSQHVGVFPVIRGIEVLIAGLLACKQLVVLLLMPWVELCSAADIGLIVHQDALLRLVQSPLRQLEQHLAVVLSAG